MIRYRLFTDLLVKTFQGWGLLALVFGIVAALTLVL